MSARLDLPTFAGGELSPETTARYDTAKYRTGLARARNVLLAPTGGAYNRPGFQFCGRVYDSSKRARLLPFQFSVDQGYALEFGDGVMRIVYDGGHVLRPDLAIQSISQTNPITVGAQAHGYPVGWDVYFSGIDGMTQINGRIGRVQSVIDADHFTVDIDGTGFSPFVGSTGVLGDAAGGEGGMPVPPTPPTLPSDPEPPSPPFDNTETPPVTLPPNGGYNISEP